MKRAAEEELFDDEGAAQKRPRELPLSPSQEKALKLALSGRNVFITGNAGSGKSFLLKRLMAELTRQRRHYALTAATGVAAWNIGGVTLHSFAGIQLGQDSVELSLIKLRRAHKHKVKAWQWLQVLIIDEVSMMRADYMRKLDTIVRELRGSRQPFGGVQLVLTGDYFQCPPVIRRGEEVKERFLFESPLWAEWSMQCVALRENFRQAGDLAYFALLERCKRGEPSAEDEEALRGRLLSAHPDMDESQLIKLCSHRATVEAFNRSALGRIEGEARPYKARVVEYDDEGRVKPSSSSSEADSREGDDKFPVPRLLELKIGAQVLLCFNLALDAGLFNGSRGTVVGFRSLDQLPASPQWPLVEFENGFRQLIEPHKWETKKGERVVASFEQVPLILRYAMTVHKAQGLTLSGVLITMDFFEAGQGYVALSRVPSLSELYLGSVDMSQVRVAPEVVEFYAKNGLLKTK